MEMKLENLQAMTEVEEKVFWRMFDVRIARDDGAAARAHLQAGRPVYYREDNTPPGLVIKEFPDGRRQLVRFVNGIEQTIGDTAAA
ncbi:hypothetical protein CAP48_12600 [Advenella sp. S44]|nr:hypothetical protein [Advenella sp. S44]PJX23381.1 hypothetical protein CAP48_12600 [Advenella sp. S44]